MKRLIVAAVAALSSLAPAVANASEQEELSVVMKCTQMATFFPVDYAIARSLVPDEYELVLVAPDKALLLIPFQDCHELQLNNEGLATPAAHVEANHAWIQVQGPEDYPEVRPGEIPGLRAKRDYYYSIEDQTTLNPLYHAFVQMGYNGQHFESQTLSPLVPVPGGYARIGNVVERILEDGSTRGFQLQEAVTPNPMFVAPVAHTFMANRGTKKASADVRCLIWSDGSGFVKLTADPGTTLSTFGSTLFGVTIDLNPMECNVTVIQEK